MLLDQGQWLWASAASSVCECCYLAVSRDITSVWVFILLLICSYGLCLLTEAKMRRSSCELQSIFHLRPENWLLSLANDHCTKTYLSLY